MTAEQILDTIAPQFSDNPDKGTYIALSTSRTDTTLFGTKYNLAIAYRAAHEMTLLAGESSTGGGTYGGLITSEREGDLSRTFADTSAKVDTYNGLLTTAYGKSLYDLIRGSVSRVMVVT